VKLLQFCSWENPHFSRTVLSELLWQIAYAYCHELRHHMDQLLSMLLIEDSWQTHRIHNALKGIPPVNRRNMKNSVFWGVNAMRLL
jgi:ubiquitin carboxyl-terminal hydrolase 9/24